MGWVSYLWVGMIVTIKLSFFVTIISLPLAALLASLRVCPFRMARGFAAGFVDVFRSVPVLALLIFLYYGLGAKVVSPFWLAGVGLILVEAAILSEIYRGAIQAIRSTQWDAGRSLGLGWFGILRLIVLPAATVSAVPGTVAMITVIIKDTSLASLVAVNELTLRATELVGQTFKPLQVYALLAVFYLVMLLPLTIGGAILERYLAKRLHAESSETHRELLAIGRRSLPGRLLERAHL